MPIELRSFGHERIDVGDAELDANDVAGETLGDLDLIEIRRLAVVDRRPQKRSLVGDVRIVVVVGLVQRLARKVDDEALFDCDIARDGHEIPAARLLSAHGSTFAQSGNKWPRAASKR